MFTCMSHLHESGFNAQRFVSHAVQIALPWLYAASCKARTAQISASRISCWLDASGRRSARKQPALDRTAPAMSRSSSAPAGTAPGECRAHQQARLCYGARRRLCEHATIQAQAVAALAGRSRRWPPRCDIRLPDPASSHQIACGARTRLPPLPHGAMPLASLTLRYGERNAPPHGGACRCACTLAAPSLQLATRRSRPKPPVKHLGPRAQATQ